MINRTFTRIAILLFIALILVSVGSAVAATNTVPSSRLDEITSAINANTLKPTSCSAISLTKIVVCSGTGTCNGSNSNELILGTTGSDTIVGKGGRDCIIGGNGDDNITGSGGTDVCIGGPGTDTFTACETSIQ
jgi:Ca2+-binding RTX toxin-like protein